MSIGITMKLMGRTFYASAEAGGITKLPLARSFFSRFIWKASNEQGCAQAQVLVLSFINHGASVALIDTQSKVFLLREQLHRMVSTIGHSLVAKRIERDSLDGRIH